MGCPSEVVIGDNLVFSVTTHDPDTGVNTDADAAPAYRIYEDETGVPILTGNMAALDAVNTTGFYSELIACTAANGFEDGKSYNIYITAAVGGDSGAISYAFKAVIATADAVWDETLSAGAHANLFSAGKRLQNVVLRGGTAISGGNNYVKLPGPWSAVDGIYEENIISIVDGTGAGQTRLVTEYIGSTRIAYVDRDWHIIPDFTSEIELLPFSGILLSQHGIATAGAANSITLSADASAISATYVGSVVYISSGTGTGQIRLITAYDGATKVATVSDNWTTIPDNTSVYKVLPVGRVIVDSITAGAVSDVWSAPARTLTMSAAAVVSAVDGDDIAILRGDTFSATITGLGDISARSNLWFSVKVQRSDADSAAIIQIDEDTGLLFLNGTAATVAGNGSIVVNNATTGSITITLAAAETDDLRKQSLTYDIQMLTGAGVVTTLSEGGARVVADVTRVIA
jgi:hypothetical protein